MQLRTSEADGSVSIALDCEDGSAADDCPDHLAVVDLAQINQCATEVAAQSGAFLNKAEVEAAAVQLGVRSVAPFDRPVAAEVSGRRGLRAGGTGG